MCISHGDLGATKSPEVLGRLDRLAVERWTHTTSQGSSGNRHRRHMGQQPRRRRVELQLPVQAALEEHFLHKTVPGAVSSHCHCHCHGFRCHVDASCSSPSMMVLAYVDS
jgi:hypothetical protein